MIMEDGRPIIELLDECIAQEQKYVFDSFSHKDAWKLGQIMAKRVEAAGRPVSVEIKVNGLVIFAWYPDGSGLYYKQVMERKHNTANVMEKSSLRFYAENCLAGTDPAIHYILNSGNYQFRGGGFPIRLSGGCVIGSIAAAGLKHTEDHQLIIDSLEELWTER